jgi:hypothetical protein
LYLVYNQIRGFKTRHAGSNGVGGNPNIATGSTRLPNDFDGYRLSAGRPSHDSNQPPLTALINRVNNLFFSRYII